MRWLILSALLVVITTFGLIQFIPRKLECVKDECRTYRIVYICPSNSYWDNSIWVKFQDVETGKTYQEVDVCEDSEFWYNRLLGRTFKVRHTVWRYSDGSLRHEFPDRQEITK